jgi:hypothetical protein
MPKVADFCLFTTVDSISVLLIGATVGAKMPIRGYVEKLVPANALPNLCSGAWRASELVPTLHASAIWTLKFSNSDWRDSLPSVVAGDTERLTLAMR